MNGQKNIIPVKVHNPTNRKVVVQPNQVICSLQVVSIVDRPDTQDEKEIEIHERIDLDTSRMNGEQKKATLELLKRWDKVIFSQGANDLGKTSEVKHTINLDDQVPFKQRHRRIPPSQYEEVRQHLREMLVVV